MNCNHICKLCPKLIISESVTFTAPNLVIDLPAGAYANGEKYCIVVAQTIPDEATRNAPVVITIGGGAVQYPLNQRNGAQATASGINSRTKYETCVATTPTTGAFRLLGRIYCCPTDNLPAIDGTAPGGGDGA